MLPIGDVSLDAIHWGDPTHEGVRRGHAHEGVQRGIHILVQMGSNLG